VVLLWSEPFSLSTPLWIEPLDSLFVKRLILFNTNCGIPQPIRYETGVERPCGGVQHHSIVGNVASEEPFVQLFGLFGGVAPRLLATYRNDGEGASISYR